MKLRERDIEKHLVQRVKALGGEVRKVQWVGRRGAPDRVVMLPEKLHKAWDGKIKAGAVAWAADWVQAPFTCWVELKAPGVKPPAYQLREHARMRAMGQVVVVIDSIEGVEELLQ